MMEFSLQLPLSAVSRNWPETQLFPRIQNLLTGEHPVGGSFWIGTDHPDEASLLIERLWRELVKRGQSVPLRHVISRPDPLFFWEEIFGTPDAPGHLLQHSWAGQIVLVHDAFYLPTESLLARAHGLQLLCRGIGCLLILAVGHPALDQLSNRMPVNKVDKVEVPRFAGISETEITELARHLIRDNYRDLPESVCTDLATRLASTHRPASRTDLERWVGEEGSHCIGEASLATADIANLLDRMPPNRLLHIATAPVRSELRLRWDRSLVQLATADRVFSGWSGRPLMQPLQELHHPYESVDPIHWFTSMVSYLACQLFDRMDQTFALLLKCGWNKTTQTIEVHEAQPEAYRVLRALRTSMQHGMSPSSPGDGPRHTVAGDWYHKHCRTRQPCRSHFRLLSEALLADWESLVAELLETIQNVPKAQNRQAIELQLDMHCRRLPQHEWRQILRGVIAAHAPELDVEPVLRRRQDSLSKQLSQSIVVTQNLLQHAADLAKEAVLAEVARMGRAAAASNTSAANFLPAIPRAMPITPDGLSDIVGATLDAKTSSPAGQTVHVHRYLNAAATIQRLAMAGPSLVVLVMAIRGIILVPGDAFVLAAWACSPAAFVASFLLRRHPWAVKLSFGLLLGFALGPLLGLPSSLHVSRGAERLFLIVGSGAGLAAIPIAVLLILSRKRVEVPPLALHKDA